MGDEENLHEVTGTSPEPELTGALWSQLILPVSFVALGAVILVASTRFPDNATARTSPGLYPSIVATVLVGAALLSVWELLRRRRRVRPSPTEVSATQPVTTAAEPTRQEERLVSRTTWIRAVSTLVLSVLYVVVIPVLGFVLTTFVYCFALSALLRGASVRGLAGSAVIAAGLVAAAYYIFVVGLSANLPRGVFF
ncbi:tripartite tricarboxylate transporter TctB family protein [Ornithinimicrobium kibberense]|uniref:Tripartite tricarboxylate transporter TctB family protein n=1 Tax=Ornithinimicrobium kibberense TaxID=282060 RepID=A0ABV5V5Y6_9MICO|nr:tripartite tricarboxylate transporter TctB family protein [Ornithinimicrobium kibberense]